MNDTALLSEPSPLRAWFYLVWLSWQRQMRARLLVLIALSLLAFAVVFVAFLTTVGAWDPHNRPWRPGNPSPVGDVGDAEQMAVVLAPFSVSSANPAVPILAAWQATLKRFSLQVGRFVRVVVFGLFLNFLLPLWSISFATDALGADRENNSLIWLLTRPLSRPAIYFGKFVAMLPWSLALNLGGFAVVCWFGGPPGREAGKLVWPAVLCGTLAFSSLFFLIGAFFRRPAVIAIVYTFSLETIVGNMPGYLKRVSLHFYTQCMMYDGVQEHGIEPFRPHVFLPVDGATACGVLLGATLFFLLLGMLWFAKKEYHEVS